MTTDGEKPGAFGVVRRRWFESLHPRRFWARERVGLTGKGRVEIHRGEVARKNVQGGGMGTERVEAIGHYRLKPQWKLEKPMYTSTLGGGDQGVGG